MSKLKIKTKIFVTILIIVFTLLLSGVILGIYLFNFYQSAPSDDSNLYSFTVNEGETVAEIAKNLKQNGFIRQDIIFRYVVKRNRLVLQAGEYKLPRNLSVADLASSLTHGTFDTKITIIEGWRREEIADYLMAQNILPQITDQETDIFKLRLDIINKIKEGYFFPDTYILPKTTTLAELIQVAKDSFASKVDSQMVAQYETQGLTLDHAIIFASIVEREAKTSAARAVVAGILLKRWQNDWPLEADATIQYAIADRDCVGKTECQWWMEDISSEDLEIDSAFNTRKNLGLPPEAICNPSLSSLQAVATPQETEYWYYLTGTDGKMYYAKTLEEHNENIAKYLQ